VTPYALRLASALWETSSMLLIAGDEAVAVDPGVTQSEIEAVRDRAASEGARVVAVVATHGDFDHVAGIASFPDAEAVMGPRAAARIASGAARREMAEEGAPLGLSWPGSPRCDRVLRVGRRERIGPFEIETMELEGHTDDGIGLRLRNPDLLIVGDYLSPIEYPFVYHSTVAYRSTLAGLADLLRADPPAQVVPGHGAPLDAETAREIAESDLAYLHALRRAVAASVASGADREAAIQAGAAVPAPRSLPADEGESRRNAERQLEELVAC
jgi:hydroxyacylglutathione hydrolase